LPGWIEKLTSATERTRPSSVGKLVLRWLTVRRGELEAVFISDMPFARNTAEPALPGRRHRPRRRGRRPQAV